MANWFHRFFNPHCPHCEQEKELARFCKSCEVLTREVERLQRDNQLMLAKIVIRSEPTEERIQAPQPQSILPKQIPWAVRRQMLESEDREKAKAMRNAAKPDTSVEELEKEMGVAEKERENASK